MLINCEHPATKTLTPEVATPPRPRSLTSFAHVARQMVATASPSFLHRMYWAVPNGAPQDDESLIGELPAHWNWLVDWYPTAQAEQAKLVRGAARRAPLRALSRSAQVHWTDGGPWYPDYRNRVNADGSVGVALQVARSLSASCCVFVRADGSRARDRASGWRPWRASRRSCPASDCSGRTSASRPASRRRRSCPATPTRTIAGRGIK